MYHDKDENNPNSCLTEIDITICPNHLKEKTEPAFEVPCSAGLSAGFNGCINTAIKALRYLADNERPIGGQENYNSEHLLQTADELERTIKTSR
jgi:hypothetical protein